MADVSDPAAAAPVSYPLSRAPRDAELTSSSCLNTAIRYWPAPWLGSAPQQQQESAVLLQRGREELALGAARRHRHGEAQAVHGQIPHHQPGRAARAAWKDSRCPLAGQAQPEPKGIELERGKPPCLCWRLPLQWTIRSGTRLRDKYPLLGEENGASWFQNTGPRDLFCSATQLTTAYCQAEITRSKSEAEKIIRDYEARIHRGEVSLGELALTESDCSSARKRGDLGYFGRGDMQKEFEDASFALKPGQISGVVDTASGLHLIER